MTRLYPAMPFVRVLCYRDGVVLPSAVPGSHSTSSEPLSGVHERAHVATGGSVPMAPPPAPGGEAGGASSPTAVPTPAPTTASLLAHVDLHSGSMGDGATSDQDGLEGWGVLGWQLNAKGAPGPDVVSLACVAQQFRVSPLAPCTPSRSTK